MTGPDPKKTAALEEKMATLGIRPQDICERFIKSSGRGGQKVNKSSSAVFLRHEPTGIHVKVGKHRSRHLNRFLALRSLVDKLEIHFNGVPDKAAANLAKIKKQKARRRKKAKNKAAGPEGVLAPEVGIKDE